MRKLILKKLREVYKNEGRIERLNMATGNRRSIDHLNLRNQAIMVNVIKLLSNPKN